MPGNKWPSKYSHIMHRLPWKKQSTLWYTKHIFPQHKHFSLVQKEEVQSAEVYNINSLDFDDQDWSDTQTCLATVRMFIEMNFLEHFQIPYEVGLNFERLKVLIRAYSRFFVGGF